MHKNRSTRQKCCTQRRRRCEQLSNPLRLEREARAKLRGGAGASEASALVRESVTYFHMRRTNRWHLLQQSGQFLRLSGQARSEAESGPTASKIDHFVEGNATCWSDACENAGERQMRIGVPNKKPKVIPKRLHSDPKAPSG